MSLGSVSASELNQLVESVNGASIELLSGQSVDGKQFAENIAGQIDLAVHARSLASICQSYSQHLSISLQPPERHSVRIVVSGDALEKVGGFEDVDWPIWSWCVRAVNAGLEFQFELTDETRSDVQLPPLAPYHPGRGQNWIYDELCSIPIERLVGPIQSKTDATAVRAGILQVNDYLDESHNNSQSVEGRGRNNAGDYWHAIMHRREPDYWNSKYWFRRVGQQSVFSELADRAASILESCESPAAASWQVQLGAPDHWDSMVFVDFCEHCASSTDQKLIAAAEAIQFEEMLLLLESTIRDATT